MSCDSHAATLVSSPMCWICGVRPANSGEHRFKASDVRTVASRVSTTAPVFLQRDSKATNDRIGSAQSDRLKFAKSICTECNNALTQPYDHAWERLSAYLLGNWSVILKRRSFDLSKPFPGGTRVAALNVHLFFVKLLGCKPIAAAVPVNVASFAKALTTGTARPVVVITIAHSAIVDRRLLMHDSEVHTMRTQAGDLHGALWLYLVNPVAVKVAWIKADARLHVPGYPWHPSRPGKSIKLSPYLGATEPDAGCGPVLP